MAVNVDFVLLMHRHEIFKPTNTGKLLDWVFPDNTLAFEWSRTDPDPALLEILTSRHRRCVLLYPSSAQRPSAEPGPASAWGDGPRLTLIVPDGTWRQAGRMVRFSEYLQGLPSLQLPPAQSQYGVRAARHKGQLATAEAVVLMLERLSCTAQARRLQEVFQAFNAAAVKMRGR